MLFGAPLVRCEYHFLFLLGRLFDASLLIYLLAYQKKKKKKGMSFFMDTHEHDNLLRV